MARKAKIEEINSHRFERKHSGRKVGIRARRTYFLIVCGGEKTEKFYFDALKEKLPVNSVQVKTKGERQDPLRTVKSAIRMRNASTSIKYDKVWVVFDKDFFDNFEEAIQEAKKNGISCAWSNVAFELWFALHFREIETALSQKDCEKCIEKGIRFKRKDYKYDKADKNLYHLLYAYGDQAKAIERAMVLTEKYKGQNYSSHNPCTKVHELVKELLEYMI